jgi:hypothetical protein
MPNALLETARPHLDNLPLLEGVVTDLALKQIEREKRKLLSRAAKPTTFDAARYSMLEPVGPGFLSQEVRLRLALLTQSILKSSEGPNWFTLSFLKDIALNIAYAQRNADSELGALMESVADKLVHQLRGQSGAAAPIVEALAGLPGHDNLVALIEEMGQGSDELMPLV